MATPLDLDEYEQIPEEDRTKLKNLTCPIPENEPRRLMYLYQTRLLDSSPNDASFDAFTHLATLIFDVREKFVQFYFFEETIYSINE